MKPTYLLHFLGILALGVTTPSARAADKPNILMIAVDDLNHWVGHLGRNPQTKTPNIDRLAKMGVTFTKAYCTAPACNPSRASVMSGLRPTTTGIYENSQRWTESVISKDKLLNTHFVRNGYRVYGAGKIYHGDDKNHGEWTDYGAKKGGKLLKPHPSAKDDGVGDIKFGPLANTDEVMPDYNTVSYCIEKIAEKSDQPFFIACGIVKPHMEFSVPIKYFDMFPIESIQLPPYRADDLDDVPPAGVKMAKPDGDHAKMVKSGRWKEAVQAYLATIAFCDAQIGRLLDALEKSPERDNTIIVLWSDHGWSLGEKSHWRKFALWEETTRSVFIWKVPGVTPAGGGVCERAVDLSSVFPTLSALAGLPQPAHLDGRDLSPLLKNPQAIWEMPAITTHKFQNHSIRTDDWRYIRYEDGSEELYHNAKDPFEYTNLAGQPEYNAKKAEMMKWLPKNNALSLPEAPKGGRDE